ncbi:MAG: hypothetical protein E7583_05685 [Ruminococcaceae bacterium]|nr:hypothetical protein [Oscillospiraceae bacterium]
MKKFLSFMLSALMLVSCMSFTISAQEAELAALDPIQVAITSAGAQQRCTKSSTTDSFGRAVTQIHPMESTSNIAPAWFSDATQRTAQTNANYAYKIVKFVYYVSGTTTKTPVMSTWAYDTTASNNMASCGYATALEAPAAQPGWNTAYFKIPDSIGNRPFHAFMFQMYGSDSATSHLNDTIYIGYMGLFESVEAAQSHVSDFEGDIVLSSINVNGKAVENFDANTTTYTFDLAGAYKSPEVTLNATGNANGVTISVSDYDAKTGTATATIVAGDKTYTVNCTGGAVATGLKKDLDPAWDDAAQGCIANGRQSLTDEFGRSYYNFIPATDATSDVAPGGSGTSNTTEAANYKALKLVYRTTGDVPQLRHYYHAGNSKYVTPALLAKDHAVSEWNTAYYDISDFKMFQIKFAPKNTAGTYDIAYIGIFGNMIDALNHETPFEGDLAITDVKLGGESIGKVSEYTYDLAGSKTVPALTVAATGDTSNVVITNGTVDKNGTATSTVKNGDETLVTVSFTGGPIVVDPVETNTDWAAASAQKCTGGALEEDEFGRKSRTYHAENQYYDGGDKTATGKVSPGGGVPAAAQNTNYKYFKVVYKSEITTVPTLSAFKPDNSSKSVSSTSGETSLEAGKWHTLYFDYGSVIGAMKMYMVCFTADDVANHIGEDYTIGYTGVFGSLEDAMAHKSAFEGDFTITDVLLDGTSIGNVTAYEKDLAGGASVPVLTIKATGNTDGVAVTNGKMSAEGNATSKVTRNGTDLVVVNFTGGSLDFSLTDILVNGTSIGNFNKATTEYTMKLPYASKAPIVTYEYEGSQKEASVETKTENGDHIVTISWDGAVKYTLTFDVDDTKPTALLNTLYKIKSGEEVTVGYFGGSVTGGTGSSNANDLSWRGLTRDWLITTYKDYNTSIVERRASVGGTGSVYGIYRADRHFIMDKAPDLCFIEMAINDNYDGGIAGTNANYVYAESIVRKIYASNPKANIIFILTGDYGSLKPEITSDTPVFGTVYTRLGEYYDIPCIYIGRELVRDKFMNAYPASSKAEEWLEYYNDIVHPTDKGYAHYANTIINYLEWQLPTGYTPTSAEYTDKALPEKSYCEINSKGDLIVDAYTVAGNELKKEDGSVIANGAQELGGYYYDSNAFYSKKQGTVTSLRFKAANIGAWVYAYSDNNGTDISYSIDGGEVQTRNFYLENKNHRYHFFAEGLDPEKEHVLRIYHDDADMLDLRYFFLSGLSENITEDEMGITIVPVADLTETDENGNFLFNVKVKNPDGTYREEFSFHPAKSKYAVITDDASLAAEENALPTIEVTVPEGYYGYEVTQATAENKIATFSVDNVKVYEFAFLTSEEAKDYDDSENINTIKTPAKKMWGIVEGQTVNAPEAVTTETDIIGVTITPTWEGADGFEFGTKAVGNQLIAYNAVYTAPTGFKFNPALADAHENSTVSEDGTTFTMKLYTYVIPSDAIYIDDGGSDSTDDYAEGNVQKPYKTLDYAMSLLEAKGGGVIVIVDKVTETTTGKVGTTRKGNYTIMGWDDESMFQTSVTTTAGGHYYIRGNTTFRDLRILMNRQHAGIYTRGFALTLGDKNYSDLTITEATTSCRQILMEGDGGNYTNPGKLTINSGSYSSVLGSGYGVTTVTGDVEIEVNGGDISSLTAGLHCGNSSSAHKLNGDIKVTVNGGNIGTLQLGSGNPCYLHNGDLYAEINGGTIGTILFRNANEKTLDGVTYPIQNGDYTLKVNGGTVTNAISDKSTETVGVMGHTIVDLVDYTGDKTALLKTVRTAEFDEVRAQVVYVDAVNGAAGNNGLTPETALPTMTAAFAKFAGGIAGKIIICGEYNTTSGITDTEGRGHVTISTAENGRLIMSNSFTMKGDTTYENFNMGIAVPYKNLFAGGYKLVMGENVTVTNDGGGFLQVGNGIGGATPDKADIEIYSGTYGLIYSGADFNNGRVKGDAILKIHGGTFTGDIFVGGYVSSDKYSVNDDTSGKIDGKAGLYVDGGTFNKTIYLGGQQYGTVGSVEAKISGGTFNSNINVGPVKPSGTYTPAEGEATNYSTNILGNAILEITGGTFTGKIVHTGNGIDGKAVVLASNGTAVTVTNPEKFDYVVLAGEKGTTTYDAQTDKFSLVPVNSTMDIYVNDAIITKSADNTYTLSGATDNKYTVKYGGETPISAKFIITPPVAELTPISEVILTGGKNTYNEIGNCTASAITWEPAATKFDFDTVYTAKVTLTALEGIEFGDSLTGLVVNGNYSGNTVNAVFSEDRTSVEVSVTFPKTAKSDLTIMSEKTTDVEVLFTTKREGTDEKYFRDTTVTLTNVTDGTKTVTGTATENGQDGKFEATVTSGIYNVTVSKAGYLDAFAETVIIDSDSLFTIDFGALIPGDIIGSAENTGDGRIDIDDFIIMLRGLSREAPSEVRAAADITESGVINVSQLGNIKANFSKTFIDDSAKYNGYFENTFYKLTVDKKLTVGYIGGSIIQGAGNEVAGNEKYIDRMHMWFEEQFPDAEIHSINAGISNTGSNFANFRLEEDLMLRDEGYVPDLVFLEFCVNDFNTFGQDHIEMLYESLIRNVYEINPNADIVCLLTALSGYDIPKAAHIKVAEHYDIPVLDVGTPMSAHYTTAGDCKIFTNDQLHPNGMGYELYAKLTKNLLEKYIIYGTPVAPKYEEKELPEQLQAQLLTNAEAIPMTDASITTTGTWTTGNIATGSRIFQSNKNAGYLSSSTAGDTLTFTFEGDAFGFMVRKSAAMGTFEYKVDDGDWRECNFGTSQLYNHCQIFIPGCVSADEVLTPGSHTVTVRVTGTPTSKDSTGCEVGIAGILYNGIAE